MSGYERGFEPGDEPGGGGQMQCERCVDAAAYVLGALAESELQPFRAHLEECAICRTEVMQLQTMADALAIGVPREHASAGLRARIMATVHAEAELLRAAGDEADRPVRPPSRVRTRLLPALAAAAALGIGLLIGALAIGNGGSSKPSNPSTQVVQAVVELPGHHATAQLRRVGSQLELVVNGLPAPPSGRIYEVWLVPRGAQTPQPTDTLFSVTHQGDGSVEVPGTAQNVSEVLVTDEPLGGTLKPTVKPVIVAHT